MRDLRAHCRIKFPSLRASSPLPGIGRGGGRAAAGGEGLFQKGAGRMADQADIFAEARARDEALFKQLAAAPVVELLGVVAPSGASGALSRGETLWTLLFSFEIWRAESGELETRPLT